MTTNQKKLITFINQYQSVKGIIPSLLEIVKGIGVSDNKSALRIVRSAIRDGYLAQIGAKISLVIPTYKGLKELGLQPLETYQINNDTSSRLSFADTLSYNGMTTLQTDHPLPLPNMNKVNTNFSQMEDVTSPPPPKPEMIVSRIQSDRTEFGNNTVKTTVQNCTDAFTSIPYGDHLISNPPKKLSLNKQAAEWAGVSIFLLGFSVHFFGQTLMAIVAAFVFFFPIFIVTLINLINQK